MKGNGFSLIELIITLAIVAILAGLAAPSFDQQIKSAQVRSTSTQAVEAFNFARLTAVTRNQRIVIRPEGGWSTRWQVFVDNNADGVLSDGEALLKELIVPAGVSISSNMTTNEYVSYVGSGASETINGAFFAGTLRVCSKRAGNNGMAIVIRYGGRVRTKTLSAAECAAS